MIGVTGTLVANLLNARAARHAAFVQELRRRTADVFTQAYVVQQAMEWVTWHGRHDPAAVTADMKRDYSAEVHGAYPLLMGAVAATAALSNEVLGQMKPVVDNLYELELRVGLAMRFVGSVGSERDEALRNLSALSDETHDLYRELPKDMARVMELAAKSRRLA